MKQPMKEKSPHTAAVTTVCGSGSKELNQDNKNILAQSYEDCKGVFIGTSTGPEGRWVPLTQMDMPEETAERWNAKGPRQKRRAELDAYFWAETNDPESQAWREELTPEEEALVAGWDKRVDSGLLRMYEKILEVEEAREDAG